MREIVLDTETTGFKPEQGDRIVEIGAVELFNTMPTGNTYHQYINPERSMPEEAFKVHGLGDEFLADKPVFKEIAQEFMDFIGQSQLVIHNAPFDMKFLNAELKWIKLPTIPMEQALDTLLMARKKFPGAQASLDALCRRFGIDNSSRTLHGALLDSEILAEVYLELLGGRQSGFSLTSNNNSSGDSNVEENWRPNSRPTALASKLTKEETDAHNAFLERMGDGAMWSKY